MVSVYLPGDDDHDGGGNVLVAVEVVKMLEFHNFCFSNNVYGCR